MIPRDVVRSLIFTVVVIGLSAVVIKLDGRFLPRDVVGGLIFTVAVIGLSVVVSKLDAWFILKSDYIKLLGAEILDLFIENGRGVGVQYYALEILDKFREVKLKIYDREPTIWDVYASLRHLERCGKLAGHDSVSMAIRGGRPRRYYRLV